MYWLLILIIPLGVFIGLSIKYRNPHTLTFIFGKKGSGKSCLMVHDMLRDLRHGWFVYTDIPDVNIPGVRIFDAKNLEKFVPPPHSSIYIDEVGILFDNRNFKSFPAGVRDYIKLQRKYKNKVCMNSQAFDVDKKIRDCTDKMILQSNIGNIISVSRPIKRTVTLTEASSMGESRIADQLKFVPFWHWKFYWMPSYFKYFDSFSAPSRPDMPFKEILADLKELGKSAKESISDLED